LVRKKARYARIEPGVAAKVSADEVILVGINKKEIGCVQTAPRTFEHATRIRDRDHASFRMEYT